MNGPIFLKYLNGTLVRLWDLPDNFCNMGNWHRCYTWVEEEKLDFLIPCHLLQSLSFHLGNQHINNDLIKILYFNFVKNISNKNKRMFTTKVCFLRTYLGKLFHPNIHKNCPVEINEFNEAVFVNFWVKQFSQVSMYVL